MHPKKIVPNEKYSMFMLDMKLIEGKYEVPVNLNGEILRCNHHTTTWCYQFRWYE